MWHFCGCRSELSVCHITTSNSDNYHHPDGTDDNDGDNNDGNDHDDDDDDENDDGDNDPPSVIGSANKTNLK